MMPLIQGDAQFLRYSFWRTVIVKTPPTVPAVHGGIRIPEGAGPLQAADDWALRAATPRPPSHGSSEFPPVLQVQVIRTDALVGRRATVPLVVPEKMGRGHLPVFALP